MLSAEKRNFCLGNRKAEVIWIVELAPGKPKIQKLFGLPKDEVSKHLTLKVWRPDLHSIAPIEAEMSRLGYSKT